jgi:hypothetical protein
MVKKIGDLKLTIDVPFTAKRDYGIPCNPETVACVKPVEPPKQLWDVSVKNRFLNAKRTIRILANSADDACDIACDVSIEDHTYDIRPADRRRRVVYEWTRFKGVVQVAGIDRRAK